MAAGLSLPSYLRVLADGMMLARFTCYVTCLALDLRALGPHYDHIARILSVTRQYRTKENASNAVVREMASALGRPEGLEVVSRYTRGCAGIGLCNFGCGLDLKGNMINSFIPLGLETGRLTILTECEAVAFNGERKNGEFRATGLGVIVRDFASGRVIAREVVRARAYVVSAAAFFSSGLLKRIGDLGGRERIGEKIYLQPHAQIFAHFDRAMTHPGRIENGHYVPHNGVPAIYNFTGLLEDYRFFWLASILFPANFATFISSLAPEEHYQLMRQFHQVMSITITLRDDPQKARVVMKDSRPHLDFRESALDINNLRQCFLHAARGFLAVGARRVFLPLLRPPRIERESDLVRIERLKFGYQDLLLYSDHTSGGNPIGKDASRGVCDEWGRVFGAGNLYVADSSLFPSASGINPSWTIMALSHRLAKNLASNMV